MENNLMKTKPSLPPKNRPYEYTLHIYVYIFLKVS